MEDGINGDDPVAALAQRRLQPLKPYNVRIDHDHIGNHPGVGQPPSLLTRLDNRWPATTANAAAVVLTVAMAWFLLYVNVTPALMAVPGGSIASIFLLYVAGLATGHAVDMVGSLPPLLGMMVAGIVLQNLGLYTVTADWCIHLVAIMR